MRIPQTYFFFFGTYEDKQHLTSILVQTAETSKLQKTNPTQSIERSG